MLKDHKSLLAEILSYLVEDTTSLAKLRYVSHDWNKDVLWCCLKRSCFLKCCAPSKCVFVDELVQFGESRRYAGSFYRHLEREIDIDIFVKSKTENEGKWATVDSVIVCRDVYNNVVKIEKQVEYSFLRDSAKYNFDLANVLSTTQSWENFQQHAEEATTAGFFLCLEDLKRAKAEGAAFPIEERQGNSSYLPVIFRLRVPFAYVKENLLDGEGERKVVLLTARLPKEDLDDDRVLPFVKFDNLCNIEEDGDDDHFYRTFAGYVLENVHDKETILLDVPVAVSFDGVQDMLWIWRENAGLVSFLPTDDLCRKCQEQHIREGVAVADGCVSDELRTNLMTQIDDLVQKQVIDYHPHSRNIVRDIVHPALYSYVKGVSPLLVPEDEILALSCAAGGASQDSQNQLPPFDFWSRPYEASAKYQWLPTYFEIDKDGSCTICDYINNLVPRTDHEPLYNSLAQLFSQVLPLIESVYGYCRVAKENLPEDSPIWEYDYRPGEQIEEKPVSLRGRQIQVVTKIVDYELDPGQSYEGVWHVEGMSHEEIVATAIYFIDRHADIEGGDILFKRAFHSQEQGYIFAAVDQVRPPEVERIVKEGLQPLGRLETLQGRLVVFPNSHVHKVTTLRHSGTDDLGEGKKTMHGENGKSRRRIIVFFLINPERRIVSTREVAVQQEHAGGSMKRTDALEHRLELMKERKFTKQDWNVRAIELCEH